MSLIAIISILLRAVALGWAAVGLWRLADWHMAPLVLLLSGRGRDIGFLQRVMWAAEARGGLLVAGIVV